MMPQLGRGAVPFETVRFIQGTRLSTLNGESVTQLTIIDNVIPGYCNHLNHTKYLKNSYAISELFVCMFLALFLTTLRIPLVQA